MRTRPTFLLVAFFAALVSPAMAQFTGSDAFTASSKNTALWGPDIQSGSGQLTQSGGLLRLTSTGGTDDDLMLWPWLGGQGPLDSSWSVQLDVMVPVITLGDGYRAVGMGIGVRNSEDDSQHFTVALENERSTGQPQKHQYVCAVDYDNDTTETGVTSGGTTGAVRISWNAGTQVLTAHYDADGPTNGYAWTAFASFNPLEGWGMDVTDDLEIYVGGYSEFTAVSIAQNVRADNFKVSMESLANLGGGDNFNDEAKSPARWGDDEGDGDSSLTEVNGRLEYTKTSTLDAWAGRPWIANSGSYTEDWEAVVDVHVGDTPMSEDHDDLRIWLDAKVGGQMASVQLELKRMGGVQGRKFRYLNEGAGGDEVEVATLTSDASLRIAFDAEEKTLDFFHDADGSTNGYVWTLLGTLDVDHPLSDWGLDDDSRFIISIGGESEGIQVPSGLAYADNFQVSSPLTPAIVGSPSGFDLFTADSKDPVKWGEDFGEGIAELSQSGDGVLRLTANGATSDDYRARPWIGDAPFATSWSIQTDVNVPYIPLPPGHTAVGMGLAVMNSADEEDTFSCILENYRDGGPGQLFHFLGSADINGDGEELFAPTSGTHAAVRISWNAATKLLSAEYDADGPVGGYQWTTFQTFNPATGGWGMTSGQRFKIFIVGTAELTPVTLGRNVYADNFYTFGVTQPPAPPVAKTLPASAITHSSATLNGSVNAKGTPRNVTFEYGLTSALGSTIAAAPGVVSGSADTPVSAALTGLLPHTKYHYRLRASGALGTTNGSTMTFTTANRAPVAVGEIIPVLPGASVLLPIFANDSDADGDALSIASFTALAPASAGKLVKQGTGLLFSASPTFTGASFNYVAKDTLGSTSASVTVNLSPGSCSFEPTSVTHAAGGISYEIDVNASGYWSAIETLPWISVSPLSGHNNAIITVTLTGNNALTSRSGTILIGGQTHNVTQDAALAPQLSMPGLIPEGIVGGIYELNIPTSHFPAIYAVTKMPPGLSINSDTGRLSGIPTKAGTYPVTIKAGNKAGNSTTILSFDVLIKPVHPGIVGNHIGLVERHPDFNGGLGSRLEMMITSTGGVTGKLITGVAPVPFKGQLQTDVAVFQTATLLANVPRPGGLPPLVLDLFFDGLAQSVSGTLDEPMVDTVPVEAWRNPWSTLNKVGLYYRKLHTFGLETQDPDPSLPQGDGFGSWSTVGESTGMLTVAGSLADGSKFTSGGFIGKQGQILIYKSLYSNKGTLLGILMHSPPDIPPADNGISGILTWSKPSADPAKDKVYPGGFDAIDLQATGGAYVRPAPGDVVMGLPDNTSNNARLLFTAGGLETEDAEFELTLKLYNPGAALVNKADIPPHVNLVKMPVLDAAKGLYSGDFTLPGATPALNRKIPFQGQIVTPPMGFSRGYGYFLRPATSAGTAQKLSGRARLESNVGP
jgi:hypothetical protein